MPRVDTFVVLLRGINVGGRNKLPMATLRELVAGLGFGDVRTHLQSGNLVCTGSGTPAEVAGAVAAALAGDLSLTVPVVARRGADWAGLVAANPFVPGEEDPTRLHVTFLDGVPDPDRVADLAAGAAEFVPDRCAVVGADVFVHLQGGYSETVLQNALLERRLGRVATTRNWRTVTALADLVATG